MSSRKASQAIWTSPTAALARRASAGLLYHALTTDKNCSCEDVRVSAAEDTMIEWLGFDKSLRNVQFQRWVAAQIACPGPMNAIIGSVDSIHFFSDQTFYAAKSAYFDLLCGMLNESCFHCTLLEPCILRMSQLGELAEKPFLPVLPTFQSL